MMIPIWYLVWIIPISAVLGVIFMFYLFVFDDCLWWANREGKDEEQDKDR